MNQNEYRHHNSEQLGEILALLDDDALWEIVHRQLSAGDVTRLVWLLEENADNALNSSELAELQARLAESGQIEQQREHAAALLRQRGRHVPPLDER